MSKPEAGREDLRCGLKAGLRAAGGALRPGDDTTVTGMPVSPSTSGAAVHRGQERRPGRGPRRSGGAGPRPADQDDQRLEAALLFTGWDWASASHAVTILDTAGEVVDRRVFAHTEQDLDTMLARLASHGSPAELVGAENLSTSRDLGILVDQPTEAIESHAPNVGC